MARYARTRSRARHRTRRARVHNRHRARYSNRRPRHRNRRPHYVRGHYSRNRRPRHNIRHRSRRHNRARHHNRARRYRYNPDRGGSVALMRPMTWLPQLLAASSGAVAATVVPKIGFVQSIVGSTPTGQLIAQGAVAVAGTFVLPMIGFRRLAPWFFVGALTPIVVGLIEQYVLPSLGLGAYLYHPQLGAYLYHPGLSGAQPPVTITPVAGRPALPVAAPVSPVRSRAIPMAPWRSIAA